MKTCSLEHGELYHGDCVEYLEGCEDNSATLAVTSPPYIGAINYEEHTNCLNGTQEYYGEKDVGLDEYEEFIRERFDLLYDVIKPGGHCAVVISPVIDSEEDERVPLPELFVTWMRDLGWSYKEDIVWEKPSARSQRKLVFMQNPYPGYYYPALVTEHIYVFQKPSEAQSRENIHHDRTKEEKERNRLPVDEYKNPRAEIGRNVWEVRPLSPQENEHPAPFPSEIPERLIKFYSYIDDAVIDPFSGSGQTCLAAKKWKRRFVGCETQEEYIDYSMERLEEMNYGRCVATTNRGSRCENDALGGRVYCPVHMPSES